MKILIIGTTGMLGYSLFKNLSDWKSLQVFGVVLKIDEKTHFCSDCEEQLFKKIGVNHSSTIDTVINIIKPHAIINYIGLVKRHDISKQHVNAVTINSLFPHQLARLCDKHLCKLIHFSTDCIFDGKKDRTIRIVQ